MTTNIYIEHVLNQVLPNFRGVWSSDNCPSLLENNTSIVVNFSSFGTPGTHFIAFFRKNKNKCYYIDSLNIEEGLIPDTIKQWMRKQEFNIYEKYFPFKIQSDKSLFCGFYCILAICELYFKQNKTKWYKKQLIKNDDKCIVQTLLIISRNK
jgi:hypothetical protein